MLVRKNESPQPFSLPPRPIECPPRVRSDPPDPDPTVFVEVKEEIAEAPMIISGFEELIKEYEILDVIFSGQEKVTEDEEDDPFSSSTI